MATVTRRRAVGGGDREQVEGGGLGRRGSAQGEREQFLQYSSQPTKDPGRNKSQGQKGIFEKDATCSIICKTSQSKATKSLGTNKNHLGFVLFKLD